MLISGASRGMNTFNIYLRLFSANALQVLELAVLWEAARDWLLGMSYSCMEASHNEGK